MNIATRVFSFISLKIILHAKIVLSIIIIFTLFAIWPATQLTIDASTDSLLLDNDPDLNFYRSVHDQYGTDEYILIVLEFKQAIFETTTLKLIEDIRQKFELFSTVSAVTSITNIPLVFQRITENNEWSFPTLLSKDINYDKALNELKTNPLYADNLIDSSLTKIAFKVDLHISPLYKDLYEKRFKLTEKKLSEILTVKERKELNFIDKKINTLNIKGSNDYKNALTDVRKYIKNNNG